MTGIGGLLASLGGGVGPCLFVWRFAEAPEPIRKLAPHFGGDEGWIVAGLHRERVMFVAHRLAVSEYRMESVRGSGQTALYIATTCHA